MIAVTVHRVIKVTLEQKQRYQLAKTVLSVLTVKLIPEPSSSEIQRLLTGEKLGKMHFVYKLISRHVVIHTKE